MAVINLTKKLKGKSGWVSLSVDYKKIIARGKSLGELLKRLRGKGNPKGYIMTVTTTTAANAVNIKNEGANAIFYALEGRAELENNANVTALVAKEILMKNTATLNYDLGLASTQFSGGPGGSWRIKKGTYRFTGNP